MAKESIIEMVDRTAGELDSLFGDIWYLFNLVQDSQVVQQALQTKFENVAQRYSTDLSISTELYFISEYKKKIFGLYIFGENQGMYKSNYFAFNMEDVRTTSWYREILNSERIYCSGPYQQSLVVKSYGEPFFAFGMPLLNKASGRSIGIVLGEIEASLISRMIDLSLVRSVHMLILNNNNRIVLAPKSAEISELTFDNLPITPLSRFREVKSPGDHDTSPTVSYAVGANNDTPLVVYKALQLNGWKVVGLVPTRTLMVNSRTIGVITVVLILSIAILPLLVSWRFSASITEPIREMMILMKRVEQGELNVTMSSSPLEEIGQLSRSFNVMVGRIKSLMNEVFQEQKILRKAELVALQAQINPHFLYNTLDSIIWLSRRQRNQDVIEMVTALTRLFRLGISKGRDVVTIEDEIDHVRSYLTIQSHRYKDKFD